MLSFLVKNKQPATKMRRTMKTGTQTVQSRFW